MSQVYFSTKKRKVRNQNNLVRLKGVSLLLGSLRSFPPGKSRSQQSPTVWFGTGMQESPTSNEKTSPRFLFTKNLYAKYHYINLLVIVLTGDRWSNEMKLFKVLNKRFLFFQQVSKYRLRELTGQTW